MITRERIENIKHDIGYFHLEDSSIRFYELDEVFDLALSTFTPTKPTGSLEEMASEYEMNSRVPYSGPRDCGAIMDAFKAGHASRDAEISKLEHQLKFRMDTNISLSDELVSQQKRIEELQARNEALEAQFKTPDEVKAGEEFCRQLGLMRWDDIMAHIKKQQTKLDVAMEASKKIKQWCDDDGYECGYLIFEANELLSTINEEKKG